MTHQNIQTLGQKLADRTNAIARNRGTDVGAFQGLVAREQLVAAIFRTDDRCAMKGSTMVLLGENASPFARPSRDLDIELSVRDGNELLDVLERAATDARQFGIVYSFSWPKAVEHDGARVQATAYFGKTRCTFHIDCEFRAKAVPGMHVRRVPSLVPGLPDLVTTSFPIEAIAADKLHAVFRHGDVNTRLADFYDLYHLSRMDLRADVLEACLERSFERFGHALPASWDELSGLGDAFAERKAGEWSRMLDRNGLRGRAPDDFERVIERVRGLAQRAFGGVLCFHPSIVPGCRPTA